MKKTTLILLLSVLMLATNGCTTATYGNSFSPIGDNKYTLKIYTGGPIWTGDLGSNPRIKKEADKFLETNPQYSSYKVVGSRKNYIPSYYEYTVQFVESE